MNKQNLKKLLQQDPVALKILRFFLQNPSSVDSVGGIATWVNAGREEVTSSLGKLTEEGALEEDTSGSMTGYSLTEDEEDLKKIQDVSENA
ncbi:MAG: hypothetical protein GF408_06070 [Candidatus Omnitrophica bacterium]|nr:hypothetical protein [Candidatus Omnitrophota bacterium]